MSNLSPKEYFAQLLQDEAPKVRVLNRGGKEQKVYFRRLTAGERVILKTGQLVRVGDGNDGAGRMEIDLGQALSNRHQLVQFSNVREDGSQVFATLADVQSLPNWLVTQLADLADEVNGEGEADAGKQ